MIKEKYTTRITETSFNIVNGKIESTRSKDIEKNGFRVYKDGKIGISGIVGKYDDEKMFKKAEEALKLNIEYIDNVNGEKRECMELRSNIPEGKELIDEADSLIQELSKNRDFIFSNTLKVRELESSLKNNMGLDLVYKNRYLSSNIWVKEKESKNIVDLVINYESRDLEREDILSYSNEILKAYRKKVRLPNKKKIPVIFSTTDFYMNMCMLYLFYTDLNGRAMGSASSIFSEYMNKKVFSNKFTLYQTNHPEEVNYEFFDVEGTVNENYRFNLIEEGIIKAPFTDKRTARIYNLSNTGAATGDYDDRPGLKGIPTFRIKDGAKSIAELLRGEEAIFIGLIDNLGFNAKGDFSTPVQVAYWFDGERLVGRLPGVKLSSEIFKMYGEDFRGASTEALISKRKESFMVIDMNVSEM